MLSVLSRFWRTSVMGSFLAGLLFLLPVMLTIVIVAWIVDFIRGGLGPNTFLGGLLQIGGGYIVGPEQNVLSFWLGLGIALVGIWLLGVIVKTQAKSIIQSAIDRLFSRVPLIRSIYNPVSRVVRLATERGASGDFSGMSVVSCRFGKDEGVDVLALLASPEIFLVRGERRRLVYLPTSPLPMSGGLVMVAEHAVTLIPEMKVDDLLKVFVSLGAMAPEAMPHAIARDAPPDSVKPGPVQTPPRAPVLRPEPQASRSSA
jgi:uncharacterized membrane protein